MNNKYIDIKIYKTKINGNGMKKYKEIFSLLLVFFSLTFSFNAYARWSFAGKFLATTASSCAVGAAAGYTYAESTGYDSQPKQVVTWMSGVTGCLTGAVFSYFFFDDPSKDLAAKNEQLSSINSQLQLQIQQITDVENLGLNHYPMPQGMGQSHGQNKNLQTNYSENDDYSILTNLDIGKIDPDKIGGTGGIIGGIKQCNVIYPIWMDDAGFVHSFSGKGKTVVAAEKWIPVSPNFAIKTWQFYFSPDGCFEQNKQYGFFERVMPGLTNKLWQELRTVEQKKTREKN